MTEQKVQRQADSFVHISTSPQKKQVLQNMLFHLDAEVLKRLSLVCATDVSVLCCIVHTF